MSRIINRFSLNDEAKNLELQKRLEIFYKNHENNLVYRIILLRKLDIYAYIFKIFLFGYFAITHLPLFCMIVSAIITGTYQLAAPIYIPFINPDKLVGFAINAIFQLLCQEIIFLLLLPLDFYFIFYSYQISLMLDILKLKFKDFEQYLANQQLKSSKKFKNLVQKHFAVNRNNPKSTNFIENNTEKLITMIKEYYKVRQFTFLLFTEMKIPIFVTITSGGLALCFSVLILLSYSKSFGFLAASFYLCQISNLCILITFVTHQFEKLLREIYEFPWYLLSNSEQKIYLQFLQCCQKYDEFKVPMIGKINMELLTDVVNTGYSYFMFIWNFFEIKNNFL